MATDGEYDDCGGDGGDADVFVGVPAVGVLQDHHWVKSGTGKLILKRKLVTVPVTFRSGAWKL